MKPDDPYRPKPWLVLLGGLALIGIGALRLGAGPADDYRTLGSLGLGAAMTLGAIALAVRRRSIR